MAGNIIQGSHVSRNLTKSGNLMENNIACEKICLEQKWPRINVMPVEEDFDCRRKRVPVHSLGILY